MQKAHFSTTGYKYRQYNINCNINNNNTISISNTIKVNITYNKIRRASFWRSTRPVAGQTLTGFSKVMFLSNSHWFIIVVTANNRTLGIHTIWFIYFIFKCRDSYNSIEDICYKQNAFWLLSMRQQHMYVIFLIILNGYTTIV